MSTKLRQLQMAGRPLSPEDEKALMQQAKLVDDWTLASLVGKGLTSTTGYAQDSFQVGTVGSGTAVGRATTTGRAVGKWIGAVMSFKNALQMQNDPDATLTQRVTAWAGFGSTAAVASSWASKATLKDPGMAQSLQNRIFGGAATPAGDGSVPDGVRRKPGSVDTLAMESLDPDRQAGRVLFSAQAKAPRNGPSTGLSGPDKRMGHSPSERERFKTQVSVDDFRSDNYGSYKDGVNKEWAPSYRRAARVLDKMGRLGDFGIGLLDIYNGAMTLGNLDASSLERSSGALNMANGVFATAEAVGALAGFDSFAAASGAVAGAFLVPMAVTSGALMFKNASRKVTDEAVAGDVAYDNYNASLSSDAQQRRVDAVENYIDALPPEKRPHSVVLNNKVADTFNQIGGPYRTSSGQFDPQDQGKTPRKDWLVKPSDVVMNSARTDHMDYDGDKPDLSTEGQLKLPDMLIDDKKGKYSRTVDHGERFEAQGYQSRGGPEFQRHYSGRNWGQQLGGEMQRRFPPDDPRAGITTLDAGRGYWEKPVNDRGDWNLALLDDQEVRDKALFPHSIPPRDPGYAESDPSHEAAQAREAFKEAQAQWADAFPASDDGVPLVRNPQPFERNFATSTQRRTVIQAGAIDHDLRVQLKHPDDRMLFSKTPDANVTVTLPPKGGGRPAIDVSGIVYRGGPAMTKLGRSQDAVSYQVWNGRRFSVRGSSAQLDALEAAIEAQLQASPKGPR